jgi:uncharacterized ferredoxin-like protein
MPMDIMGPFRTDPTRTADSSRGADDVRFVVVETDESEHLVFQGATQEELDAKVEDFLTWAS